MQMSRKIDRIYVSFLFIFLASCNGGSTPQTGDETPKTLSQILSDIDVRFDGISKNSLTEVGDSQTFTEESFTAKVLRISSSSNFSMSASTSDGEEVSVSGDRSLLDNQDSELDLRMILNDPDPFSDSSSTLSPTLKFSVTKTDAEDISSLNTSTESITVSFPCDTSSCSGSCYCECFGRELDGSEWSKSGVTSYYSESTPNSIVCKYKNTNLFVTAFVQDSCPQGYSSTSGNPPCSACTAGRYQDSAGQTSCDVCDPGTYTPGTAYPECLPCAAGRYNQVTESTSCTPCAVGRSQSSVGQTECDLCPAGKYEDEVGSTNCKSCPAGKFSNSSGQIACTDCDAGKYQSSEGQTNCIECAAGTYASSTGQSTCDACPPGRYQDLTGQITCVLCAPGYFTASSGTTSCTPCVPGTYAGSAGSIACTPCAVGYFGSTSGSSACTACPEGTYQDSFGSTECMACSSGQWSSAGSSSCVPEVSISLVTPPSGGVFTPTDSLSWTLGFSEAVDVTGNPRIAIDSGGSTFYAAYASGSGTANLIFTWTLSAAYASVDDDGISVSSSSVDLNGGTIEAVASGKAVNRTLPSFSMTGVYVQVAPVLAWYDASLSSTLEDAEGDHPGDSGFSNTISKWISRVDSPTMDASLGGGVITYGATLLNSLPSIDLPGNAFLEAGGSVFSANDEYSVIAVVMHDQSDGDRQILGERNIAGTEEVLFGNQAGDFRFVANGRDELLAGAVSGKSNPYILFGDNSTTHILLTDSDSNSTSQASANLTLGALQNLRIGRQYSGGQYWDGRIAEIIIFDDSLASNQFTTLRTYLGNKWGID